MNRTATGRSLRRALALLAAFALLLPAGAGAETGERSGVYPFTSSEPAHVQLTDRFVWRDDCFCRSSFRGCGHLLLLSAQAAMASHSLFGNGNDDPADDGENIARTLTAMGFTDVETNGWYSADRLPNSCGAAMGRRKIRADGKTWTLVAIVPGSGGYRQEWAGNFTVGTGDVHEGFRQARDEVLRFAVQYFERHGISGDLKLWIPGHSRGGAVANLLGGFFAGGGIARFEGVRLAPEDIYCCTFAAPAAIRPGASLAETLSIGGARGGSYAADTPGEPWTCPLEGTVRPDDPVYAGIRNVVIAHDLFAMLPPAAWGYTRYGRTETVDFSAIDADRVLEELEAINPPVRAMMDQGADCRDFAACSADIPGLALRRAPEPEGAAGSVRMMQGMADALVRALPDAAVSAGSGAQEGMAAMGGLFGLTGGAAIPEEGERAELIHCAALVWLACSVERADAEDPDDAHRSDAWKAARALTDLVRLITGEDLDPDTALLDDLWTAAVTFLTEHGDSALTREALRLLDERIGQSGFLAAFLSFFVEDPRSAGRKEELLAFLRATKEGPAPGTLARDIPGMDTPERLRMLIYTALSLTGAIPVNLDGTLPLTQLADHLFATLTGTDGGPGLTIAEAGDTALRDLLDLLFAERVESALRFGPAFRDQAAAHLETLKRRADVLRRLAFAVLFPDGWDTAEDLGTAATFFGNTAIIAPAHYNENYVALARTMLAWGIGEH